MAAEHVHREPRSRWFDRLSADGTPPGESRKRFPRRWLIRLLLILAILLGLLLLPLACATVVTPPTRPADPVMIYLLDHGRTSSLVLPTADGGLIRYVYGNWEWYALKHTGVRSGLRALIWPSQATLGRHRYQGPATPDRVQQIFATWSEGIFPVTVSRAKAARLERELDKRFHAHLDTLHVNTTYGLEFVRDAEPYYLFHNSNRMIADWLRQAGCQVRGPAILSRWKVREPQDKGEMGSQESGVRIQNNS